MATPSYAHILLKARLTAAGSNSVGICNSFLYKRQSDVPTREKSAVSAIFATTVFAPLLAAANSRYGAAVAEVRWLDDVLDPAAPFPLVGSGAIITDSAPSYAAVSMRLLSGIRGRNWRGRKHFAGVSESDTTGDVLTGAGLVNWQAVRDACLLNMTDTNGNVWTPHVLAFSLSQLESNPTIIYSTPIVDVVLNLTLGTMAGRKATTTI